MQGLQEGSRDESSRLCRVGTLPFLSLQGLQKERRNQDEKLGCKIMVGAVLTRELWNMVLAQQLRSE